MWEDRRRKRKRQGKGRTGNTVIPKEDKAMKKSQTAFAGQGNRSRFRTQRKLGQGRTEGRGVFLKHTVVVGDGDSFMKDGSSGSEICVSISALLKVVLDLLKSP